MIKSGSMPAFVVSTAIVGWLVAAVSGAQSKPKPEKPADTAMSAQAAKPKPVKPAAGATVQAAKPQLEPPTKAAAPVDDPNLPPQTILMPGLYLFQTRTRDGSCNDAPRTGYVTSSMATLDGVPGSRTMTMQLLNSKYWPTWTLSIGKDESIAGSAVMLGGKDESKGTSRFDMRAKKERFQGVGSRSYPSQVDGKPVGCTLNYDVLLKPID
jgi:hypothetical protein